jgi:hypothetical protein
MKRLDASIILTTTGNQNVAPIFERAQKNFQPRRDAVELPWSPSARVTLRPEIRLRGVFVVLQNVVRLNTSRSIAQLPDMPPITARDAIL